VNTTRRILSMVPGVEVVGQVDADLARALVVRRGLTWAEPAPHPATPEEARERRELVARLVEARGADTLSHYHHNGHQAWSHLASLRVSIRHVVSVLAEALGCAHPDRFQAAINLGDPAAVVEQTRGVWSSWGLSKEEAKGYAQLLFSPSYAAGASHCTCGRDHCEERLIQVDVMAATLSPAAAEPSSTHPSTGDR
jgi:hypothetical protein